MNERIKELGAEAWKYADQNSRDGDGRYGHLYRDKLAELIVKECSQIVLDTIVEPGISVANARSVKIFMEINKHFGIEEE
jgi:hypothetical protein